MFTKNGASRLQNELSVNVDEAPLPRSEENGQVMPQVASTSTPTASGMEQIKTSPNQKPSTTTIDAVPKRGNDSILDVAKPGKRLKSATKVDLKGTRSPGKGQQSLAGFFKRSESISDRSPVKRSDTLGVSEESLGRVYSADVHQGQLDQEQLISDSQSSLADKQTKNSNGRSDQPNGYGETQDSEDAEATKPDEDASDEVA